ncbi:MAG: hypothetical protein KIS76_03680 [Pyrinomonadaceae bacterium]|nr:hypothetical protein [Pyrinomonadaceae bacterium]
MKKLIFTAAFIVLGASVSFAQSSVSDRKTDPNSVETEKPGDVPKTRSRQTADENDNLLKAGTVVQAELQSVLDVRRSKVGDEVVLKTTETIKHDGEVIIPKGTKLIGQISEVQQKSKGNGASKLGVVINSLEGKNLSTPITASIVSITNASNGVEAGDLFGTNSSGSNSTSGSVSNGGGLLGGGLVGGAAQAVGATLNAAATTVGGLANGTVETAGGAIGNSINGLTIDQSADGSATLMSTDKNLKIDKGANFRIRLGKPNSN